MDKIIAKAECIKQFDPYSDGHMVFKVGEKVDLTEGYKEKYAILVPCGICDIDIDDGYFKILQRE